MISARALSVVLCALSVGCAGHAGRTEAARSALDAGRTREALRALNDELDVKSEAELPDEVGGDNTLLLLDRAMVLQELASTSKRGDREYRWSSRDLETADKQVEVLDLSRNAAADIGKYLFSDDTGPYKAPTYEKLLINTMNMVNYLALGDLNGAKIEARRLAVMQKFIDEHDGHGASLSGPGSYLAGFAFEKSGRADEALLYYDEALEHGSYASLVEPVRRLAATVPRLSPRLKALLEGGTAAGEGGGAGGAAGGGADPGAAAADDSGEILIVVGSGRVPAKIARRIPIGLALTYVSGALSPTDASRANYLAGQGLVTWVNFPELGKPSGTYETPTFALDGAAQSLEEGLAIDQEARKAWDEAKGTVIASAITRMIARAATGEAVRRGAGGGIAGALLSLGTQATLTAVDTPDTRSWATLPARINIGRVRVRPGKHEVTLESRGATRRQTVTVAPRGWAVVNLTVLR